MEKSLNCQFCDREFDTSARKPKMLLACGHSICQSCLEERLLYKQNIICEIDNLQIDTSNKTLQNFPDNLALLQIFKVPTKEPRISEEKKSLKQTKCKEHKKIRDIVCIDCKMWICYKCGLFGSHKGHKIVSKEEYLQEEQSFEKEINNISENLNKKLKYFH